jgi:membrane-associated PAP2 superfamily phosphatase
MLTPVGGVYIRNGKAVNRVVILGFVQMVLGTLSNAIEALTSIMPRWAAAS